MAILDGPNYKDLCFSLNYLVSDVSVHGRTLRCGRYEDTPEKILDKLLAVVQEVELHAIACVQLYFFSIFSPILFLDVSRCL